MQVEDVKTIAVIGAGDMGHGIAEVALISGYKVFLRDVKQEFVDKGVKRITDSLEKLVGKGKVPADHYKTIKSELLHPCTDLKTAVEQADLAIEAIPEIFELKQETFQLMDQAAPSHCLLASNTSTMSISKIASATNRPDKVLGLHYFNPAVLMKLVEVIRGEKTSSETMKTGVDFVLKTNKIPARVEKDIPGFIVNRVQAPASILLNAILDENIAEPEEVDAVMRNLGMPMGPYETLDFTGLDVNLHVCSYFAKTVHPDFAMGKTLQAKVKAGELGKKTGKGIFDWSQGRPKIDPARASKKFDPMDIVAVNANEATKIVAMGTCRLGDVDTAIVHGTGNPAGLISLIKDIDPIDLTQRLEGLAKRFNKEVFKPSDMIKNGGYR